MKTSSTSISCRTSERPVRTPSALATFSPAYFALVMATGIISIASGFLGFSWVARVLFAINLVAYVTIWVIQLTRLVRYPGAMLADRAGPGKLD